jgi:cytochrome P450
VTTAPAQQPCPVHADFDPLSAEYLADPYAVMAALPLATEPVFYAPPIGYYIVTRHADIEQVFRDPETYSAAVAQLPLAPLVPPAQQILLAGGYKPQPSMASLDEPAHGRLRRPAARAFSAKRVNAMIPAIEQTTARLLDAVAGLPQFDLVAMLSFPLPANIVFSLIGVQDKDYAQLKQWCGYRLALSFGRPTAADQVGIATNIAAYRRYLRELVDAKVLVRGDDLTSDLIAIHEQNPDQLTLDEISSILFSLSIAGHETTTALISNTVRRLLEHPRNWQRIADEPQFIAGAVEETLRFDPSVTVWRRVTTRPVTLGRISLPAGARLFLWLAAAGRDPSVFGDPDRFDPQRPNASEHLAFGKGRHYCLGASLGKLETRLAVEHLARRFPRLRLAEGQQLTFHPNISFRGPLALLVRQN